MHKKDMQASNTEQIIDENQVNETKKKLQSIFPKSGYIGGRTHLGYHIPIPLNEMVNETHLELIASIGLKLVTIDSTDKNLHLWVIEK